MVCWFLSRRATDHASDPRPAYGLFSIQRRSDFPREDARGRFAARGIVLRVLVCAALAMQTSLASAQPPSSGARHSMSVPPASPHSRTMADTVVLSLLEVQRLALTRNASFLAAREDASIARGGLQQARLLRFNPDLQAQLPGVIAGTSDEPGSITLLQELELAGQRRTRIAAARAGVSRASAGVSNAARLTIADASVAFFRTLAAERRRTVAQAVLGLNERLATAVRTQLREGEISVLDANLAEIEVGRARGRVLAAQRDAATALLELTRQIGLAPSTVVRLEDNTADDALLIAESSRASGDRSAFVPLTSPPDSLIEVALRRRADLAERVAAIREAEALTTAAQRERFPNLRLGVFVERRPESVTASGSRFPRVGPALGITLPFLNRNQGVIAQREALATQARYERDAAALRVETDVTSALRAYETASAELDVFTTTVLDPARRNSDLLDTAFQAGKIPLPTLLLLRNQLLDAELGYWDAWLAQHTARVQLDAATGALQPTVDTSRSSPSPSSNTRR